MGIREAKTRFFQNVSHEKENTVIFVQVHFILDVGWSIKRFTFAFKNHIVIDEAQSRVGLGESLQHSVEALNAFLPRFTQCRISS